MGRGVSFGEGKNYILIPDLKSSEQADVESHWVDIQSTETLDLVFMPKEYFMLLFLEGKSAVLNR